MSKLVRRHERKIAREGKQQNRVNASSFEQPQFFRKRSQQLEIVIGTQDPRRVRLKGDNHGLRVSSLCSPHDFIENMPMSPMHAVEVADANQRGTKVAWNVVEFVENQHRVFHRRDANSRKSMVVSR